MEKKAPIWDFVEDIRIHEVNRNTLTMYYKSPGEDTIGTRAELMFDNDDKGTWQLLKQCSIHTAEVQSYSHIYFVATVFPKVSRVIKQNLTMRRLEQVSRFQQRSSRKSKS